MKNTSITVLSFLALITIHTNAQEQFLADSFVWPVLSGFTVDPEKNIKSPITEGSIAICQPPEWHIRNSFGNQYAPAEIGCVSPHDIHPGVDFNLCPLGSNLDQGQPVFSISDGVVEGKGSLAGGANGYYLTIRHSLPRPLKTSDYIFPGTTTEELDFDTIYSSYLHINFSELNIGNKVRKGQQISTISNCCSHLHLEVQTAGAGVNHCGGCGYCTSTQALTTAKYLDPLRFISANTKVINIQSKLSSTGLRLQLESINSFGAEAGTISVTRYCQNQSCSPLAISSITWSDSSIEFEAQNGGQLLETGPLSIRVARADDGTFREFSFPFRDIKEMNWYAGPVLSLWLKGVVKGRTPTFYWPESDLTRAEFIALLWRASGHLAEACSAQLPFDDVGSNDWFCPVVSSAQVSGWLAEEPHFRPNDPILRSEAAAIVAKLLPVRLLESTPHFVDLGSEPGISRAIAAVDCAGIMSGPPNGTNCSGVETGLRHFCPSDLIDRAQAAAIVERLLTYRGSPLSYLRPMNACKS